MALELVFAFCLQQEAPSPPGAVENPQTSTNPLDRVHGILTLKYRYRWTTGESDSDLYEFLQAGWGDPEKDLVTLSSSVRVAEDLDGNRKVAGFYPYNSLDDTYGRAQTARLYTAYVDLHRPLPGFELRGGRQVIDELPEAVPMDGGSIRFSAEGLSIGGFGGIPVNLFESQTRGDSMYGGWVEATPWARGRAKVEALHIKDETLFGLFENDLVGFSADQGIGFLRAHARYTNLDGDSRDLTGRLTGTFGDLGLIVDAQATYLFASEKALAYAIDPYALFLMDVEPYVQWTLRASQALGAKFGIDFSVTQRKFVRGSEDEIYNHEFIHASLSPRADEWPVPGLSLSLSADYWRSTGDDYWTAGGDVSYKIHPLVAIGAGTSYALYTIDVFSGEERDRARLFYASLRWKLPPSSVLDVRVSWERNAIDRFRTVEVGARHEF